MRQWPVMKFRTYIRKYASKTSDGFILPKGLFYCEICGRWINKQRWIHFKKEHRYKKRVVPEVREKGEGKHE